MGASCVISWNVWALGMLRDHLLKIDEKHNHFLPIHLLVVFPHYFHLKSNHHRYRVTYLRVVLYGIQSKNIFTEGLFGRPSATTLNGSYRSFRSYPIILLLLRSSSRNIAEYDLENLLRKPVPWRPFLHFHAKTTRRGHLDPTKRKSLII